MQQGCDLLVEPFHTPGALAYSTEHPAPVKGLQNLLRPVFPGRINSRRLRLRARLLQCIQIIGITRQLAAALHQARPRRITLAAQQVVMDIVMGRIDQYLPCQPGISLIDGPGQLADATAGDKAVRVTQHHRLLRQRVQQGIPWLQAGIVQ